MTAVHLAAMEGHSTTLVTLLTHRAYANFMDYSEDRYIPVKSSTVEPFLKDTPEVGHMH